MFQNLTIRLLVHIVVLFNQVLEVDYVTKQKILIVDDSKTIHAELDRLVNEINFEGIQLEVEHSYGYEEFRKVFVPEKYALVMTDLVMEEEDSGIKVINHVRHTSHDQKTRVVLMTANPEKIPSDFLTKDYDVNAYLDKNRTTEFMTKLTIISMLKTYKDLCALETAVTSLEMVATHVHEMNLPELLISTFFQIRTFLSLRDSTITLSSEIFINGKRIFPPTYVRSESVHIENKYVFRIYPLNNDVRFILYTSRPLNKLEKRYSENLLKNIENTLNNKTTSGVEEDIVIMLSKIVEVRSEETGDHVNRVAEISQLLAQAYGFSSEEAKILKGASALHDIGKIGIPDHILNKPAKLDEKEFAIMKEHSLIGFELLRNMTLKVFELGAVIALEHHERWDGTGYPYGLEGNEISLEARVVQVADVFEALTHNRCYRPAWPVEQAIEYMNEMSGRQFDPAMIDVFNKHLKDILDIVMNNTEESNEVE